MRWMTDRVSAAAGPLEVRPMQAPQAMPDETERAPEDHEHAGLWKAARAHPALSVLGAAGLGLLGGFELAAGVLIGAGVIAALRHTPNGSLRERAKQILDRAPHDLRERARALVQAARGKTTTSHESGDAHS